MTVDESYWTLEEELKLLDSMIICGPDNWEGICKQFVNRSPAECEKYYVNNFLLNPKYSELIDVIKNLKFNYSNTRRCNDICCCLQYFDHVPNYDHDGNCEKLENIKINAENAKMFTVSNSMNNSLSGRNSIVEFDGFYDLQKSDVNFKKEAVDKLCNSSNTELYYPNIHTIIMKDELNDFQTNACKEISKEVQEEKREQPCVSRKNIFEQNFSNISDFTCYEKRNENDSLPVDVLDFSVLQNVKSNLSSTDTVNFKGTKINSFEFSPKSLSLCNKRDFLCDIDNQNFSFNCCANLGNLDETEIFGLFNTDYDIAEFSSQVVEKEVEELLNGEGNSKLIVDPGDCVNENISNISIKMIKPGFDELNNLTIMKNSFVENCCLKGICADNDSSSKNTNFLNVICSNYKLNNRGDNLKTLSKNSLRALSLMTGYNPARNEFDVEYDNKAEEVLMHLCCNNECNLGLKDDLLHELSLAIIFGYNFRLSERLRRKNIVRCYDLTNPLKAFSQFNKLKHILGEKLIKKLIRFLHLMSSEEFDHLLKKFEKIYSIKDRLNKLIEYRQHGLTKLGSVELFEMSKRQRDEFLKKLRSSATPILFLNSSLPIIASSSRRSAPPITVTDMPGFSELDEAESEFCSVNRILPNFYLQFKDILTNECIRKNGIKLANARIILKIDVNKTRKLYDFLLERNLIWSPHC